MDVVVITGMSGAGRRTAAHAMEDLGWYVVDNLPPAMLPALTAYLHHEKIEKVAVVLDVRSRGDLEEIPDLFFEISPLAGSPQILFLEADDPQIVTRQESSRRPVPLQGTGTLLDGIRAERRMMSTLRASADMVIDTTAMTSHQLTNRIVAAYGADQADLTVTLVSFGFKNGVPLDADMVFDVRFLPNPHWIPDLRPQTGLSSAVSAYVLSSPLATQFLQQVGQIFSTAAQGYLVEGKRLVMVAIGCTGGKHRSVAMAEAFARDLEASGQAVTVIHRDLGRE
ncbi:MAG: RNase adapter RapZ [Propionibacteriaceae bacterium]|nr:RNase adapter RapZ [Propionibacteriaceae bacterium]